MQPPSTRAATRRAPSTSSPGGSTTARSTRCCSASPVRARPSRWPRSSSACSGPALVLAHNKTLAAQLYREFKSFFPDNAVEYFVSYYDYYQPEAYIAATDTYIEKDALINDEIDRLRLSATRSLFERRDCVIVASVSCIYGLGSPEAYYGMLLMLEKGQRIRRDEILRRLVEMQYERNEVRLSSAASSGSAGTSSRSIPLTKTTPIRIETVRRRDREHRADRPAHGPDAQGPRPAADLSQVRTMCSRAISSCAAIDTIKAELEEVRTASSKRASCSRRSASTSGRVFDIEMMKELGYCHGIENYSRHLTGRLPGRAASDAARLSAAGLRCCSSTRATRRSRRCAACTSATARGRRTW